MEQSAFICAAVNYKQSDRTCELLAENTQTAFVAEPIDDTWQHFIRPICAGTVNIAIIYEHYFSSVTHYKAYRLLPKTNSLLWFFQKIGKTKIGKLELNTCLSRFY